MKPDIANLNDIKLIVNAFYQKALTDDLIGIFFTETVQLNWQTHIPTIYRFWQSVLLNKATYKGQPIDKHIQLNKVKTLKPQHFNRWLQLWEETIYQHFTGKTADAALQRAQQIAYLMQFKIEQSQQQGFIK